jgi:hypothetical protein
VFYDFGCVDGCVIINYLIKNLSEILLHQMQINPALRTVRNKCFRRFLQMQNKFKSPYVNVLTIVLELRPLLSA